MRGIAIKALQCGSIPQHVGFIMDGNRRYGRKVQVGNGRGYYLGYETMEEVSFAPYLNTQMFHFDFSLGPLLSFIVIVHMFDRNEIIQSQ